MTESQTGSESAAVFLPIQSNGQRGSIGFRKAAGIYVKGDGEDIHLPPLIDYFGDTPLDDIDQTAVDEAARILKPLAAASTRCRQIHTPVSAIIKYCAISGLCRWRRFERPRSQLTRECPPSVDEARRLVLACAPHIRPLVLLLFEGGRFGEVLRFDWSQVDLDMRRVMFRRNGKVRILRLHERTVGALMKLPHRKGRVFRTPSGREYVSERPSIKTAFKGACRRAGIRNLSPRNCTRAEYPFNERPKNGA